MFFLSYGMGGGITPVWKSMLRALLGQSVPSFFFFFFFFFERLFRPLICRIFGMSGLDSFKVDTLLAVSFGWFGQVLGSVFWELGMIGRMGHCLPT